MLLHLYLIHAETESGILTDRKYRQKWWQSLIDFEYFTHSCHNPQPLHPLIFLSHQPTFRDVCSHCTTPQKSLHPLHFVVLMHERAVFPSQTSIYLTCMYTYYLPELINIIDRFSIHKWIYYISIDQDYAAVHVVKKLSYNYVTTLYTHIKKIIERN